MVIGKSGATIREIENLSGARLQLDATEAAAERKM